MLSTKPKLQLLLAFTTLLLLALAVGCRGFFVNPTLTTVTVGPATPSIEQGQTLQMVATGTYDDGSTKSLAGSNVLWSTDDVSVATISKGGLLTGVGLGSTTITASSGTISGSTTATVQLANVVSISITPTSGSITVGGTIFFTAIATVQGGQTYDITDSAIWTSSDVNVATIDTTGMATGVAVGTTNITATSSGIVSNVVVLTVN